MTYLEGKERADYVQQMFTRIAGNYDLMNRLMTGGQDVRWRREVIRQANLNNGGRLLDLGTGTGDLARDAQTQHPEVQVTAADFTLEMMRVGKSRDLVQSTPQQQLSWSAADALNLPFEAETFDAVISGFLLRNVIDVRMSLADQYRVLKPAAELWCSIPRRLPITC